MTIVTATPRTATARDLLYLSTPELWPLHPFLPIIRYKSDGEMDCGVLYDVRDQSHLSEFQFTVFLTNLFQLPETETAFLLLPKEQFDSLGKLVSAGWVVD